MGKMSFPENENKPSRTITATKIANSRESILYKSEIVRVGDGEFRLPTVREAAIIMGFPITYQFLGSENTKWRLIGNAVCCSVSRAIAGLVLDELGFTKPDKIIVSNNQKLDGVINLNTFSLKRFDSPPIKNKGSRFRRHPIKDGNLTVTLSNYRIEKNSKSDGRWYTSIQYGTGKGYPIQLIEDKFYIEVERILKNLKGGSEFISIVNNGFSCKIANSNKLQEMYELQKSQENFMEPTELVDEIEIMLDKVEVGKGLFIQDEDRLFHYKDKVPIRQVCALYTINKISTIANSK